jgi:hypothetical protein
MGYEMLDRTLAAFDEITGKLGVNLAGDSPMDQGSRRGSGGVVPRLTL